MESFFAVTTPGLEAITAQELRRLNLLSMTDGAALAEAGGVAFQGDPDAMYHANLWLRTASRILLRVGEFHATAFSELRDKAGRIDWARYVRPAQPVVIRATCHKSKLSHSDAVAERIIGAIADRLGVPVFQQKPTDEEAANPPQLIVVRLVNNRCTVSIDTSGELLHRRGYRQAVAKAPLRETLAAAMLFIAEWDTTSPLIDPFCGSGTIAIEAALLALGLPPGRQRRFAFMDWPGFDEKRWAAVLADAQPRSGIVVPPILASDRDAGAIRMAQENARRAGVAGDIEFICQAVSAIRSPARLGWVITNPPYGIRVSANRDLRNLYAQLGNVLRAKCPDWHVAIMCTDLMLLGQTRLALDTSHVLMNGGIKVRVAKGVVTHV